MAGQGLPTTPSTTTVTKQYITVGQNDGTPSSYIEVSVSLRPIEYNLGSTNEDDRIRERNRRIQALDPDGNGWIADTSKIRFKFVRKRDNGFKISYTYNENNDRHFIKIEYDGGKSKETLKKLKDKLTNKFSGIANWKDKVPFYLSITVSGNEDHKVPWSNNVDPGERHFATKTLINLEEEVSEVDDSFYTASANEDNVSPSEIPEPEFNFFEIEAQDGEYVSFSELQKDICEKLDIQDDFGRQVNPNEIRICPTCIPDPNYTPEDWISMSNVWLDQSTCKYVVKIRAREEYRNFLGDNPVSKKEDYIKSGVVRILNYFNKLVSDQEICAYPPADSTENCGNRISQEEIDANLSIFQVETSAGDGTTFTVYQLSPEFISEYQIENPLALELYAKAEEIAPVSYISPLIPEESGDAFIKITIPANLIDLMPEDQIAEESEQNQEELQNLEKVILKGPNIKKTFKKVLPKLFKTFGQFSSIYKQTQNGRVRINTSFDLDNSDNKPFYVSRYETRFETFYEDLNSLLKENKYNLYPDDYSRKFTRRRREAVEVKIVLTGENEDNPFEIKSVLAKYRNCPFKKCGKGLSDFIDKYNKLPTLMSYIMKSNDMIIDIEGNRGVPPWKEFLVKYTSPPIFFPTGNPQSDDELNSCLDNQEDVFNDLLLDVEVGFSDALQYAFSNLNCRDFKSYNKIEYNKIMFAFTNPRGGFLQGVNQLAELSDPQAYENLENTIGSYIDYYNKGEANYDKVNEVYQKLVNKSGSETPFFQRMTGKTIQEAVSSLRKNNPADTVGELLYKLNPCNWEDLTIDIMKCLLKGLNPVDALLTAAKSLLSSQEPEQWEKIFKGLPTQQQIQIKRQVEEQFGALPTPLEFKKQQESKNLNIVSDYEAQRSPPQAPNPPGQLTINEQNIVFDELEDLENTIKTLNNTKIDLEKLLAVIDELFVPVSEIQIKYGDPNTQMASVSFASALAENYGTTSTSIDIASMNIDKLLFINSIYLSELEIYEKRYNEGGKLIVLDPQGNELNTNDSYQVHETYTAAVQELESVLQSTVDSISEIDNSIANSLEQKSNLTQQTLQNLEDIRFANDVNAYEKAIQNTLGLIVDLYTQALLDVLEIDEIRKLVDNIPGSEILGQYIATITCPNQTAVNEFIDELIGGIEFNPCYGKYGWRFPEISYIPPLDWMEILKSLLVQFSYFLISKMMAALSKYLLRVLEKLLSRVCDMLSGVGVALLGKDETNMLDAIADAFCSEDRFTPFSNSLSEFGGERRDEHVDTLRDLVKNYADKTYSRKVIIDWVESVSTNVKATQFLKIFVEGAEQDTFLVNEIWNSTEGTELGNGIFPTIEDLKDFLNSISNSLPNNIRSDIEDLIESLVQNNEQTFADYCESLKCADAEPGYGLDSGVNIDSTNDPSLEAVITLEDVFDGFLNGPEIPMDDIINDLTVNPGDPFCDDFLDSDDDAFSAKGASSLVANSIPPELKEFQKTLSDSIFDSLERSYTKDIIGTKNSFFNSVLADSDNVKFSKGSFFPHDRRVNSSIIAPNAANNQKEHNENYDDGNVVKKWYMRLFSDGKDDNDRPFATNLFPDTVGKYLSIMTGPEKFYKDVNYQTKIYLKSNSYTTTAKKEWKQLGFSSNQVRTFTKFVKNPDVSLKYRDRNGGKHFSWGFDLNYSNVCLEMAENGDAYYDTTLDPYYEIEAIEYNSTFPPSTSFEKFKAFFTPAAEPNEVQVNDEFLFSLKVPIRYKNFESTYEKYRAFRYREKIDKNSRRSRRSHQEESFINFVLDDQMRSFLINTGVFEEGYGLKKNIQDHTYNSAIGQFYSPVGSVYGKIKNLISKNLLNGIYNASRDGEISNAYKFGYSSESEINFNDLLYVNPEADPNDTKTWKYNKREGDKILGKSATENKRVVFLDPEIYGGTYKNPKIYIHPYPFKGWLGIMQSFNPELDGCDPKKSGWLFLSEVSERVNKLENSLKKDVRFNYDPSCVRRAPYDLIADSSTHAYLDGVVVSTIRTYIVETLLRCMPTLSNLEFNSKNYDDGMGLFLLSRMKEEMKDYPLDKRGSLIAKYRYWYLFLEQCVQTTERRILSGEIEKDEQLTSLFEDIQQIKKNYYYPTKKDRKLFKRIEKISWDSNGEVDSIVIRSGYMTNQVIRDNRKLNRFIDSIAFCAFGPDFREVVKSQRNFEFKAWKIKLKDLRMYTKIYSIYLSEDLATQISSYLILNEFYAYQDKIKKYLPERPYIQDINKFVLNPKSGLTIGKPINVGTIDGEYADVIPLEEYGDVVNVVDEKGKYHILDYINVYSPKVELYGAFYLEKYVYITSKVDTQQEIKDLFDGYLNRPISVTKFSSLWNDFLLNATNEDDLYISQVFGNAVKTDDENYSGTIGIKFGVRLSYLPPKGYDPTSSEKTAEEIDDTLKFLDGLREYYYKKDSSFANHKSFKFPIALLNYDQDVQDVKIKDFKFWQIDDNLKCYIDKLTEMEEYKWLMEYVFNIRSFSTMSAIYSYYAFPDSVGELKSERPNPLRDNDKEWIGNIMSKTKKKCYILFKKYYKSQTLFKTNEDRNNPDMNNSLAFKKINKPEISNNLKLNIRWWQRKRFQQRPYDEYGRECVDGALAAFDQFNDESRPPNDSNDYEPVGNQSDNVLQIGNATPVEASTTQQEVFLENSSKPYFTKPTGEQMTTMTPTENPTFTSSQLNALSNIGTSQQLAEENENIQLADEGLEQGEEESFQDIGAGNF